MLKTTFAYSIIHAGIVAGAMLTLAQSAAAAPTAEYRYTAGLAIVGYEAQALPDGRKQTSYKLLGAAQLSIGTTAHYGSASCKGRFFVNTAGKVEDDASDCVWTDVSGDSITWHYAADAVNTGPGFQHAQLKAVSGTGKWQGVSGTITTDVMFKPHLPDAPVNFVVGSGDLAIGEK